MLKRIIILMFIFSISQLNYAQDVELFQQFNGRFDYTAIGNTMNLIENGPFNACDILTASSATLNLDANQNVVAAYLYWAGSGTGDLDIRLNDIPISADRVFSDALDATRVFFAAFADVTSIIQEQGNVDYTISEFDISSVLLIPEYCQTGTNFAGWAITIIYQDDNTPLNQVNVYDGLQSVPTNLSITLDNLNVLDNQGAKIGFIAWEGDEALAVNEQLSINGNPIGNPPLNPVNNAFNGTNSFTGATNLFNMDIDVYDIQNNINIGDTSAIIELTSGQDFVMINNVITVLNSQLPDATIAADEFILDCGDRSIELTYTVFNSESTNPLPAGTPIAFYANNELVGQSFTINAIGINESETNTITLTISDSIEDTFNLILVVDDDGTGTGLVTEINENNNTFLLNIELLVIPDIQLLLNALECNEGFNSAVFNLVEIVENEIDVSNSSISFYTTLEDLQDELNAISIPEFYNNTSNPQTIFLRVETPPCYEIFQFNIMIENCPPHIPEGFSPNDDNKNDWFNIQGLYDIFEEHELLIYNRYGTLIFVGDNSKKWFGRTNRGLNNKGVLIPVGTYFYVLHLNDPDFGSESGWVYVNY